MRGVGMGCGVGWAWGWGLGHGHDFSMIVPFSMMFPRFFLDQWKSFFLKKYF